MPKRQYYKSNIIEIFDVSVLSVCEQWNAMRDTFTFFHGRNSIINDYDSTTNRITTYTVCANLMKRKAINKTKECNGINPRLS